jgi:hypothetical protein
MISTKLLLFIFEFIVASVILLKVHSLSSPYKKELYTSQILVLKTGPVISVVLILLNVLFVIGVLVVDAIIS